MAPKGSGIRFRFFQSIKTGGVRDELYETRRLRSAEERERERENKVSERDVSVARKRTKRWIRRQDYWARIKNMWICKNNDIAYY